MKNQAVFKKELAAIADKEDMGKSEKFQKSDYEFVMTDRNRIQFKNAIKKKKNMAFGRLQSRRNMYIGKKGDALKTIKEDEDES